MQGMLARTDRFLSKRFIDLLRNSGKNITQVHLDNALRKGPNTASRFLNECLRNSSLGEIPEANHAGGVIREFLEAELGNGAKNGAIQVESDKSPSRVRNVMQWLVNKINSLDPTQVQLAFRHEKFAAEVYLANSNLRKSIGKLLVSYDIGQDEDSVFRGGENTLAALHLTSVSAEDFRYAWYLPIYTLSDASDAIRHVLSEAEAPYRFAFHFDSTTAKTPCASAVDIVRRISTFWFEKYPEALGERLEGASVLVSQELRDLVGHEFCFEPIGEALLPINQARPVIHKVWACRPPIQPFEDQAREFLSTLDERGVYELEVEDPDGFSRCLIDQLKNSSVSSERIQHWRCNGWRQRDLLRPVDQCLAEEVGFNCRSPSNADARLSRFVNLYTPGNFNYELRRTIVRLLTGGHSSEDFQGVLENLTQLFQNLSGPNGPLTIIVENSGDADEVTDELLSRIQSFPEAFKIRVLLIKGIPSVQPKSTPALSEDERLVLDIAATLGVDVCWDWLRDIWLCFVNSHQGIDTAQAEQNFEVAVCRCLSLGILYFSDGLLTNTDSQELRTQLGWTSNSDYLAFNSRLSDEFKDLVARHFWASQPQGIVLDSVEQLRCKWQTFHVLDQVQGEVVSPYSGFMFRLAKHLAERAIVVNAYQEASERLQSAYRWYKESGETEENTRAIQRLIARYLAMLERWGSCQETLLPVFSFIRALARKSEPNGRSARDSDMFLISRTAWSYVIRHHDLNTALPLAEACRQAALSTNEEPHMMEAYHALTVTYFQLGLFAECEKYARLGMKICAKTKTHRFFSNDSHPSHDGRVCCKMFYALSRTMQGKSDDGYVKKAIQFAETHDDATTKAVAHAYAALFHILDGNIANAREFAQKSIPGLRSEKWDAFRNLILSCVEAITAIGEAESHFEFVDSRLHNQIQNWPFDEFKSFWKIFRSLLLIKKGDFEAAARELKTAQKIANRRGEAIFLPIIEFLRDPEQNEPSQFRGLFSILEVKSEWRHRLHQYS